MKKKYIILFVIIGFIVCLIVSAYIIKRYREPAVLKQTRLLMDTYCTIQIPGNDKSFLPCIERSFQRIEIIDKKFNCLSPESSLFSFNQAHGVCTDKEICDLVATALQVSKESSGCFDITVYPLLKLWGFYTGNYTVPDKKAIEESLDITGYEKLEIRNDTLFKQNPVLAIDLGGIAKGYAIQEAVEELKKAGVASALVDAGGDLYALGMHNGKPWKLGIRNPRGDGILGVIEVSDMSVVTSGDYERFFEKDGIQYHHIFDPKTGYPARGMISVTVICKDAVMADAWSTALFVMEPDEALRKVEQMPELEAVLITSKGEIIYSAGLKDNLEIKNKGFL